MNKNNQVNTEILNVNNILSFDNIINIGSKSTEKSNIETNNNEDTLTIDNINLKNNITYKDDNYKNDRIYILDSLFYYINEFKLLNWTWSYDKPYEGDLYYSLSECINNYYTIYNLNENDEYIESHTFYKNKIYKFSNETITFSNSNSENITLNDNNNYVFTEIKYTISDFSSTTISSYNVNTYYFCSYNLNAETRANTKFRRTKVENGQPTSPSSPASSYETSNILNNYMYYIYYKSSSYCYTYRSNIIYYNFSELNNNNKYYLSLKNYENFFYNVKHINNNIDHIINQNYIYKCIHQDNNILFEEIILPLEDYLIYFIKNINYKLIYDLTTNKWIFINIGNAYNNNDNEHYNFTYSEIFNDYINNISSGLYSHAEGFNTIASGDYSHAEGYRPLNSTKIGASGKYSHSEGYNTVSSGLYSHAEGYITTASNTGSHSEGYSTSSSGIYSHAEGYSTTASGSYSHAEGRSATASGYYSHASGYSTTANSLCLTTIGRYNTLDGTAKDVINRLFVVGNGTGTSDRSDAFEVHNTGDVIIKNSLITPEIKNNISTSSTEGNITTNEYSLNIGKKSTNKANIITTIEEENNSGTITINNEYDTLNIDKINTSSLKLDYELIGVQRSTNPGDDDKLIATKAYVLENSGGNDIGKLYPNSTHGEIFNNYNNNVASGDYSHADGFYTSASGNYSHASGSYTTADQNNMFVVGKYNNDTSNNGKLFVVGNGDQNTKSDALVVKDDGSVLINDKIVIDNVIQSSNKYGNITLKDYNNNETVKLNSLNGLTLNTNKSVNDIQLGTNNNDNKILTTKSYVDDEINNIDLSNYVQKDTSNTITANHTFSGNLTLSGTNTFSGSSNTFNNVINTNGGIKTNTSNTDLNLSASSNNINMNTNNNTTTITFDVSNGKISNNKVIIEKSGSSNISGQIQILDKNDNSSIIINGDNGITTEKLNMVDVDSSTTPPTNITINNIKKGGNSNNNTLTTQGYVDNALSSKADSSSLSNYVSLTETQTNISGQKSFTNTSNSLTAGELKMKDADNTSNINTITKIQKSGSSNNDILTTKGYNDATYASLSGNNTFTGTNTFNTNAINANEGLIIPSNKSLTINSNSISNIIKSNTSLYTSNDTSIYTTLKTDNLLNTKLSTSNIITTSSSTSSSDNTVYSSLQNDNLLSDKASLSGDNTFLGDNSFDTLTINNLIVNDVSGSSGSIASENIFVGPIDTTQTPSQTKRVIIDTTTSSNNIYGNIEIKNASNNNMIVLNGNTGLTLNSTTVSGITTSSSSSSTTLDNSKLTTKGYVDKGLNTKLNITDAVGQKYPNSTNGEIFNCYNELNGSNYYNIASGSYSHAEGQYTTASGSCSHSEGQNTIASGICSHAEGDYNYATGFRSHAEGYKTKASGNYSHSEGGTDLNPEMYSYNYGALGNYSHSEGYCTTASGDTSHAGGNHTNAYNDNMTTIGQYNIIGNKTDNDGKLFVVGNGTSNENRNDAFVVDNNGNVKSNEYKYFDENYTNNKTLNIDEIFYIYANNNSYNPTTSRTITDDFYKIIGSNGNEINSVSPAYYYAFTQTDIINNTTTADYRFYEPIKLDFLNLTINDFQTNKLYQPSTNRTISTSTLPSYDATGANYTYYNYRIYYKYYDTNTNTYKMRLLTTNGYQYVDFNYYKINKYYLSYKNDTVSSNPKYIVNHINGTTNNTITQNYIYKCSDVNYNNNEFTFIELPLEEKLIITIHDVAYMYIKNLWRCISIGNMIINSNIIRYTNVFKNNENFNLSNTASGLNSHAEGYNTIASGLYSHSEGYATTASGSYSHAEGYTTKATNSYSHSEGYYTTASGSYSHSGGYYTIADKNYMTAIGICNVYNSSDTSLNNNKLFVVGNGTSTSARSDAFVVYNDGNAYVKNNLFVGEEVNSNGSDYAELFESYNNLTKNDFKGKFITLEEDDKVRIANNEDDYILGVYSFHPSVLGNNPIDYPDKYLKNEFTEIIYEDVKQLKQEFIEINNKKNNNIDLTDEEIKLDNINDKYEIIKKPILNDKYNDKLKYIQRKDRDNWIPVGMLGKLLVIDNGTCKVNSYCKINFDGTAIPYDRKDGNIPHYRVIKRNNDKTIFIIFK